MILRRITEHVKAQNWTAVALDFFIVVVGVFIGLQVNDWNQYRNDRATEIRYIADLAEDIEMDRVELAETKHSAQIRVTIINRLLAEALNEEPLWALQGGRSIAVPPAPLPDSYRSDEWLMSAQYVRSIDRAAGAYETLTSTGAIRLMRDHDLVRAMQTYYAEFAELSDTEDQILDFFHRILTEQRGAGLPFSERYSKDQLLEVIGNDKIIAAGLKTIRTFSIIQYVLIAGFEEHAASLSARLDAALGEAPDPEAETIETPL